MLTQIADILRRQPAAVIEDMAGVVALAVILVGALHLPGMV